MWMAIPIIGAAGYGGYKAWAKWGKTFLAKIGMGHPHTAPPAVQNLPSANPSGGTIVPSAQAIPIPQKGESVVISNAVLLGTTSGGNPISGMETDQLATDWSAAGQHLFDYLKAHGADGSTSLSALARAFQSAIKTQGTDRISYGNYVAVNGVYDLPTSSVLSVLIGDPIPAQGVFFDGTSSPHNTYSQMANRVDWIGPDLKDDTNDDAAMLAANNLYFYLRKYGHVKGDPKEMAFVSDFQKKVNDSPMFKKHGLMALVNDGLWGGKTQAALKVYDFVP
jgi:hypothetical protein